MPHKSERKYSDYLERLLMDRSSIPHFAISLLYPNAQLLRPPWSGYAEILPPAPTQGTHSTSAPVITAESCSSWLQLSPSCQSLDNSGHIIGLYWQNVIIFHQPRRCWCRGCESLQCWLLCCVLLMMMIFKLSDISAQVSRVWAPSPVSRVTRPENWQLGLQLTAGQRSGSTSQTW